MKIKRYIFGNVLLFFFIINSMIFRKKNHCYNVMALIGQNICFPIHVGCSPKQHDISSRIPPVNEKYIFYYEVKREAKFEKCQKLYAYCYASIKFVVKVRLWIILRKKKSKKKIKNPRYRCLKRMYIDLKNDILASRLQCMQLIVKFPNH